MDITFIKTFLELSKLRHFGRAAEALFITQSAVSARIRLLEENLGLPLLTRDRNNIQLTPAGIRFQRHAENIVSIWNLAKQEVALDDEDKKLISVGGMFSLWDSVLPDWLARLRLEMPDIAVRAEALDADTLISKLREGALDLAFFFEMPRTSYITSEECGSLELVMVSSEPDLDAETAVKNDNYILVDWGTEFQNKHAQLFAGLPPSITRVNLGRLALDQITGFGGSAYLVKEMIEPYIESGQLFTVRNAPVITRRYYAAYNIQTKRQDMINNVLNSNQTRPAAKVT